MQLSEKLTYHGFSLEPIFNAHREFVVIVALISLLPLILIPRFCEKNTRLAAETGWCWECLQL